MSSRLIMLLLTHPLLRRLLMCISQLKLQMVFWCPCRCRAAKIAANSPRVCVTFSFQFQLFDHQTFSGLCLHQYTPEPLLTSFVRKDFVTMSWMLSPTTQCWSSIPGILWSAIRLWVQVYIPESILFFALLTVLEITATAPDSFHQLRPIKWSMTPNSSGWPTRPLLTTMRTRLLGDVDGLEEVHLGIKLCLVSLVKYIIIENKLDAKW